MTTAILLSKCSRKWNFTRLADKVSFPSRSTRRNWRGLQRSCRPPAVNWKSLPGKSMEEVSAGAPAAPAVPRRSPRMLLACLGDLRGMDLIELRLSWGKTATRHVDAFAPYACGFVPQRRVLVLNLSPKSRFLNVRICSDAADPPPTTANGLLEICAVSPAFIASTSWCRWGRVHGRSQERRISSPQIPSQYHPSLNGGSNWAGVLLDGG